MNKTTVALAELETVEIDFYDHEIYAASKLIASIGHDDDLTQPWLVLINGVEVFRHDTFKRCHSFITWHYKENTLPEPQAVVPQVNAYAEPVEEAYEEFQPEETTTTEQPIVQPLSDWDFTPPKFNCSPGVICPDCDGHGCGNCGYRGTRAEDLCTPVDGYRLTYVGRTDLQTAHNVYLDSEFLGIVFKVRNADELWENDPKTYYWRCGDGVQYWSVKEAIVALSKVKAVEEMPQVRRELVAA
ncbi:hypothetical protein [Nostoc sp. WHI]|uniref:hypothetical protein n=1 Tax=Nostoc sp. WHI TaxID=2650611 RepID=UPI001E32E892|nr:hypothetical protein [Nostoc sp. WHI]